MIKSLFKSAFISKATETTDAEIQQAVCDNVEPLAESFDAERYMGAWYEIQHTYGSTSVPAGNQTFLGESFHCNVNRFSDYDAETGEFTVTAEMQFVERMRTPRIGFRGDGSFSEEANGQATLRFFNEGGLDGPNYKIIETDYENYSMVYYCNPDATDLQPYLWILSREPTLDQDIVELLNNIAKEKLPNYDFDLVRTDIQGHHCKYDGRIFIR